MLRIWDVYPGSWFLSIPDPGSNISNKYHKIKDYFSFEHVKKNMCVNLQRIVILSTQKIVIKLKNMGLGFGIRGPDPQQWWWLKYEAGGQFEILLYKVQN